MSSLAISVITLGCVFGGALIGMILQTVLPRHHLSEETKDVVKLGMGLVGTMAALVLGLLVASAKGSYDTQSTEVTDLAANVVLLDRALAHYGPEAKELRGGLSNAVSAIMGQIWSQGPGSSGRVGAPAFQGEAFYDRIQQLSPKDDNQRALQAQALGLAVSMGKTRWLMYAQNVVGVSVPMLVILVGWLAVIFASFGLFAPRNATVLVSLFVSALSVSGAILLILEMYAPYSGLIQISDAPLRAALTNLGR
ncbi:MAG TPA: hypothetical protein VMI34_11090 [Candidatus Bathyarchaeia archaeon]|nr:hypothetical protein [Candidatus Bathyarchaeia archaeon]